MTSHNHKQDFVKILNGLTGSRDFYTVFNDWTIVAAYNLLPPFTPPKEQDRTESDRIWEGLSAKEQAAFGELFCITIKVFEDVMATGQGCDFFGEVFLEAGLGNKKGGQFFTPYQLSLVNARLIMTDAPERLKENGLLTVNDPTCGAGGMLVAGAMACMEKGVNFQDDVFFVGQDIDARCIRMSFIQCSLLGMPAVLMCGDSLALEFWWQRKTIGYYLANMDYKLRQRGMIQPEAATGHEVITPALEPELEPNLEQNLEPEFRLTGA